MRFPLDAPSLAALVAIALGTTVTEYPHKLDQELRGDGDLRPPRQLQPSFYGCYDWHSAVHSHWLLARALRRGLAGELREATITRLDEHLAPAPLAGELAFFRGPGGASASRPYGWAWLTLLHAECASADEPAASRWAQALAPLAAELGERLERYLESTLAFPIRSFTHSNSAFSLTLALRAARLRGDDGAVRRLAAAARRLFVAAEAPAWPVAPAGDAFLSPALAEAALLVDVLDADELGAWLQCSRIPASAWAPPAFAPEGEDPGTVHLEGLLLSRAWSLHALAEALAPGHPTATLARRGADAHIAAVADLRPGDGFNRAHWLPTFVLFADEQLRAPESVTTSSVS